MVSSVSGSVDGWLWNGSPSLEIPQSDWEVFDGFNWSHDSELKVTKGELIPCGMWNGHPVYKNNERCRRFTLEVIIKEQSEFFS